MRRSIAKLTGIIRTPAFYHAIDDGDKERLVRSVGRFIESAARDRLDAGGKPGIDDRIVAVARVIS